MPGISDQLKTIATSFGIKTWFTFPGKLLELSTEYRGRQHASKSQNVVYCCTCRCGHQYVGETGRNLKVRLSEHLHPSSNSAFSEHLEVATKTN